MVFDVLILAAGEGRRLSPLTKHTPKPLLKIHNKSLLEHNLFLLKNIPLKHINIVTGYKKELINNYISSIKDNKDKINIVIQNPPYTNLLKGILAGQDYIKQDKFIVIHADNLLLCDLGILCKEADKYDYVVLLNRKINKVTPKIIINAKGCIEVKEKEEGFLSLCGYYVLSQSIFNVINDIVDTVKEEEGLLALFRELTSRHQQVAGVILPSPNLCININTLSDLSIAKKLFSLE